jgi:hypothetical protein
MIDSLEFKGGKVKATIPRELYFEIVRLQGSGDLDWNDACKLGAQRISRNTKEFEAALEREYLSRHRSALMTEFNKGRKTIEENAKQDARKLHEIWFYCSICDERISVTPSGACHKHIMSHLRESGWGHAACHKKGG